MKKRLIETVVSTKGQDISWYSVTDFPDDNGVEHETYGLYDDGRIILKSACNFRGRRPVTDEIKELLRGE